MADVIFSDCKLGGKSLMSFPSKFKGKCKDCGKENKAGEIIDKNKNDNWCKDGPNCQGAQQTTGSPKPSIPEGAAAAKKIDDTVKEWTKKTDGIKNAAWIEEQIHELQNIEKVVLDNMGENPNVQKVGMYVKEIYKQKNILEIKENFS